MNIQNLEVILSEKEEDAIELVIDHLTMIGLSTGAKAYEDVQLDAVFVVKADGSVCDNTVKALDGDIVVVVDDYIANRVCDNCSMV